jgi:hypothetical protein
MRYNEVVDVTHIFRQRVSLRFSGGETIFCLVLTHEGKKIFLQPKNFLLMRYKARIVSGIFKINTPV